MAAVARRHREKAVGQEAIVSRRRCHPRGAGGLGCSVGMGQQGPRVLPGGKAASHGGCAEAQEGLATRGAQSFGGLCQGQLVVVERGLELRGREVGPSRAVGAGAGELSGAEEASCRPAAPQQGQRGFGAALHPRELGRRRAVGKTQ